MKGKMVNVVDSGEKKIRARILAEVIASCY